MGKVCGHYSRPFAIRQTDLPTSTQNSAAWTPGLSWGLPSNWRDKFLRFAQDKVS